jgi:hypothetical protein
MSNTSNTSNPDARAEIARMVAAEMEKGSLLAPHVAAEIAENAVAELLKGSYLITNGKVHSVVEVNFRGDDASGLSDAWDVYTQPQDNGEDEEYDEGEG